MRALALHLWCLLLLSLFVLSACGEDSGTESADTSAPFTAQEASQVSSGVTRVLDAVRSGTPGIGGTIEAVDTTVNCPVTGRADIVGTRDPNPLVDLAARVTYTDCVRLHVQINGSIDVTATSAILAPDTVAVIMTFAGTVATTQDGQTRSCRVAVTRAFPVTSSSPTRITGPARSTGHACGQTINTITPPP